MPFSFLLPTFSGRRRQRDLTHFLRFLRVLIGLFIINTLLFHFIMLYEGQEYSWISGFYWTLTTMSTLGFGDITFTSDIGRLFSIIVMLSGIVFLLVLLPFTFIQHFYLPWLESVKKEHIPCDLPPSTTDHVILVGANPLTLALADDLTGYGIETAILCKDIASTTELLEQGYNAVMGEHDNAETYHLLHLPKAAMLVAMDTDQRNTNTAFTAREVASHVSIIAHAENSASVDILKLAGCSRVYQFHTRLGRALARRVLNLAHPTSIITKFNELAIAEAPLMRSSLVGKTIQELAIRSTTGVNIVGVWERGKFSLPRINKSFSESSVIVAAGTAEQINAFDEYLRNSNTEKKTCPKSKVLILGGGRVGKAAVEHAEQHNLEAILVDKKHIPGIKNFVLGDAADLEVLERAGLREATAVIITTHDDDTNIYLTIYCRRLQPDIQIISRATFEKNVGILHKAGADQVLSLSSMISNTILNKISPGRVLMINEGLNIFRAGVVPSLVGISLAQSGIRARTNCSVIAVAGSNHKAMLLNPPPDYEFLAGDDLYLIGDSTAEDTFNATFKPQQPANL